MTPNPLYDAAERYRASGMHPFPCRPGDKKPIVKWEPFQTQAPTANEVESWWTAQPRANIALATGRGMCVVDLDGDGAEALLTEAGITLPMEAPRVKTGRGCHVYLQTPHPVGNRTAMLSTNGGKPQVDLRGDGGYVIAPPSLHETGSRYAWLVPLRFPLPVAPDPLLALIARTATNTTTAERQPNEPGWFGEVWGGVGEGQRNNVCAKLAGYLLRHGHPTPHVLTMLAQWGARCTPPFSPAEIRITVASIAQREAAQDRPPISATELPSEPDADTQIVSAAAAIDQLRAEWSGPAQMVVPTPFGELNHLLYGGFRGGQLTYLAARPSIGKSALAIEFARSATAAGHRVMMVSLESKATQVMLRGIAQEGKHAAGDVAVGRTDSGMERTMANLSRRDWSITRSPEIPKIVGQLDALAPVHVLIVDYLQLLRGPREIRDRRLQVEWISRMLKQIAVEREMAVLCLSSVTRSSQDGIDKPPTLSSMRESGELEHDADVVMLLHRTNKDTHETLCNVAKNRDGKCGVVNLIFRPEFVSFSELATDNGIVASNGGLFDDREFQN